MNVFAIAAILGAILIGALGATVYFGNVCEGHEGQTLRGTPKARGNNTINPLVIICHDDPKHD